MGLGSLPVWHIEFQYNHLCVDARVVDARVVACGVDGGATLSYPRPSYLARVPRKSTYLAVYFLPHVAKCHFVSDSIVQLLV